MATPKKVILDCDPGHDDAFAMFVAHGHPALEVVAVTTVCGNQTVERVTRNALGVGELAGMHAVRFAQGAARPLIKPHQAAPEIHGDSGLDGPSLPQTSISLDPRSAAHLIVDLVMASEPGEITLVATAALTNLALALRLEPRIAERVAEVAIMGGAIGQGNVTASAEFNIYVDPHAARIVFEAPWKIVMMGLDVSHQALATPAVLDRLTSLSSPVGDFCVELLDYFGAQYLQHQGFESPPVHDLCPVIYLIDPTVFNLVRAPVAVDTTSELTMGRTVVDLRLPAAPDCRHQVATGLDHSRFFDIVVESIGRLG
ncbi:nucleoside hydrolase [Nakamurella antarctica]|uniref:Nucleoside hydrolase n=1 Tax=Nakamurella antarctica TaxID=1902245 RepID=A0A3G8ZPL4_9ACTN|nr:nucleoside hydrolase [Nakamurella antarctica]AZI58727.1 nucleoside hydrolase [Nakamurella antarctica]